MKKVLIAVVALAVAAAPASATGFAIFGSGWQPDTVEDALGGGVSLSFPLGDAGLGLDLRGSFYQEADLDNVGPDNGDVFRDFGLQIIPVDAALRFDFNNDGPANFYIGGGASYLFLDLDNGPDLDDEVGWLALVGAQFGDPDGARFFVEGAYRGVEATVRAEDLDDFFDDDEPNFDEDVAIELDGPMVNLGVVWGF
jgi:hypothetical protein